MHPLLEPAAAKLRRADKHIADLEPAVAAFLARKPWIVAKRRNAARTEETWSVQVEPIDEEIMAIAADAIHNLRTPLDKMLCARVRPDLVRKVQFPMGEDRDKFAKAVKAQAHLHPNPVTRFLEALEVYPGGPGELLYHLHLFDIGEKHRSVLTPVWAGAQTIKIGSLKAWGGRVLVVGSRRGQHLVETGDGRGWKAGDMNNPPTLAEGDGPGARAVQYISPPDDMDFLTITPGTRVEMDPVMPNIQIAFDGIPGLEGEPILHALARMREAVVGVLADYEARFFPAYTGLLSSLPPGAALCRCYPN